MTTLVGVTRNLWRTKQGLVIRRNFPIDSLGLYLPLGHPELSGTTIVSKDLNAHSCTVTNAVHTPPTHRAFDGDDCIAIPNHASLVFGNGTTDTGHTFIVWVNMTDATDFFIFEKGTAAVREYFWRIQAADKMDALCHDSSNDNFVRTTADDALTGDEGSWVMYAVTKDTGSLGSGINLYRGTLTTSVALLASTDASGGTYVAMDDRGGDCVIGRYFTDGAAYSNGNIGELWAYGRELSIRELEHIYNATRGRYV